MVVFLVVFLYFGCFYKIFQSRVYNHVRACVFAMEVLLYGGEIDLFAFISCSGWYIYLFYILYAKATELICLLP